MRMRASSPALCTDRLFFYHFQAEMGLYVESAETLHHPHPLCGYIYIWNMACDNHVCGHTSAHPHKPYPGAGHIRRVAPAPAPRPRAAPASSPLSP